MQIHVFGGLHLFHGDVEVAVGPPMQQGTLALLLASRGRTVSAARLVDVLWESAPPATARNQIQKYIGRLRHLLEPDLGIHETGNRLVATRGGYRLATAGLVCDLDTFDEAVAAAASSSSPDAVFDAARTALDLAALGAFGDLDPAIRAQDEFLALDRQAVGAAVVAADVALRLGRSSEVVQQVRAVANTAPLDEPVQACVLRLLAAEGRTAEALATYDLIRRRLRDELGVDPGVQLRNEYAELLRLSVPGADQARPRRAEPPPKPRPIPRQLPADVAGFVERAALGGVLDRLADGRPARVLTISGMPGIGKTALAVHWAHRLAAGFPDGQLFVNLRGFDPGEGPLEPATALEGFLRALGVERDNQQSDQALLSSDFRSAVAGKRLLFVLDNARDADQVRPLLPGSSESMVIVTSRNQLPGLVAREGAEAVRLDPLRVGEANALLDSRIGPGRFGTLTVARDGLLAACSGLPLALTIVSARAALNPQLDINEVAAELTATMQLVRDRTATSGQSSDLDLVSIFDWSYEQLSPEAAELFTALSASPNRLVCLKLAASLVARSEDECRVLARQLSDASLIEEPASNVYTMHDLLRAYAAGRLKEEDRRRLLEPRVAAYYLHSTSSAWRTTGAPPNGQALGQCPPGVHPEAFTDTVHARDWYVRERSALDALAESFIARGSYADAVRITLDRRMVSFDLDPQEKFVAIFSRALEAATMLGDELLVAEVRRHLGRGLSLQGKYEEGRRHLELAAETFESADDQAGQTLCLYTLGALHFEAGQLALSETSYIDATHSARAADMDWLAGIAASEVAKAFYMKDEFTDALEWCELSRELNSSEFQDLVIREVQVRCYSSLERYAEAIVVAEREPSLYADRELVDADVTALPTLAYSYYRTGDIPKALAICAEYLPRIADIRARRHTTYVEAVDLERVREILEATGNEIWAAGLVEPTDEPELRG